MRSKNSRYTNVQQEQFQNLVEGAPPAQDEMFQF